MNYGVLRCHGEVNGIHEALVLDGKILLLKHCKLISLLCIYTMNWFQVLLILSRYVV